MNRLEARWMFSPAGLFEDPQEIPYGDGMFSVDNGVVSVTEPIADGASSEFIEHRMNELHRHLEAIFLAANVLAATDYELSSPGSIVVATESGGRNGYAYPKTGDMWTLSIGAIDIIAPGIDTRAERIAERQALTTQVPRLFTDELVRLLLKSLATAVSDAPNEFVHLYEVRDALQKHFQGGEPAQKALGISPGDWDEFGRLTNGIPVLQSRHRGQHGDNLRSATPEELAEARAIARRMVRAYLDYLDRKDHQGQP